MFSITFEYDEATRLWEVYATGATDSTEAVQGFNAVVETTRMATPSLEAEVQEDGRYKISVGIRQGSGVTEGTI